LPDIADGIANLADTVRQHIVGDDDIRPDRLDQLVLRDDPIRVFNQKAQYFESLVPQFDFATGGQQTALRDVQRVACELERPRCQASVLSRRIVIYLTQITDFVSQITS